MYKYIYMCALVYLRMPVVLIDVKFDDGIHIIGTLHHRIENNSRQICYLSANRWYSNLDNNYAKDLS